MSRARRGPGSAQAERESNVRGIGAAPGALRNSLAGSLLFASRAAAISFRRVSRNRKCRSQRCEQALCFAQCPFCSGKIVDRRSDAADHHGTE
jgi:hypothetical protein